VTENELKHAVLAIAKRNGWLVYHVPMATVRGSQGRGYPDLTLARNGTVLWLELKQEHGRFTADQERWAHALPAGDWRGIRPSDLPSLTLELA
jgi:hypothetical protein